MSFQQRAFQFYTSRGYAPAQAAALAANANAESGGRPSAVGDAGKAMGLFQWHPDRQANLRAFAQREGLDPGDERAQLGFKDWEFSNTERRAGRMLRAATTPEAANAAVLASLRPSGYSAADPTRSMHYDRRLAATQSLYGSGGAALAAAPSRADPPALVAEASALPPPADPVYADDLATSARRFGNYIAPGLIDPATPLTPEQATAQTSEQQKMQAQMGQLVAAQKSLAALSALGQRTQEPELLPSQAITFQPRQFKPIPKLRGLL